MTFVIQSASLFANFVNISYKDSHTNVSIQDLKGLFNSLCDFFHKCLYNKPVQFCQVKIWTPVPVTVQILSTTDSF